VVIVQTLVTIGSALGVAVTFGLSRMVGAAGGGQLIRHFWLGAARDGMKRFQRSDLTA
jgi:hypothetical protein